MIHAVKGFSIVNEADVFLERPCFLHDPMNADNLILSSASSNPSLYIWKYSVHILLKPSLKDFEHNLASMWNECNCRVVWTLFGIALLWIGMKTDLFQSCGHCWVFQTRWHTECSTLKASYFRIWNSSTRPPLALFIVMLPKTHLTSHSRMPGSRWMTIQSWLSRSLRPFLYSSSVYSSHLFLISSASFFYLLFLSFIVLIFVWNVTLTSLIFLKRSLVFPILSFPSNFFFFALFI